MKPPRLPPEPRSFTPVTTCRGCEKPPTHIREYIDLGITNGTTPEQAVRDEEGTYNEETGRFWCTNCYIKAGMPLGKA